MCRRIYAPYIHFGLLRSLFARYREHSPNVCAAAAWRIVYAYIVSHRHIEKNRLFLYNVCIMRTKLLFTPLYKKREEIEIVFSALVFRLVVYLLSAVILSLLGNYAAPVTFSDFLWAWTKWDSPHYIDIAAYGYSGAVEDGQHLFLVFYPLLPWLLRGMHFFVEDYRLCGILLNLVCFCVGSLFFYKLTKNEYGDAAAKNSVLLLSVFPFGFFYGAVLTESLFLALSAMFLYYLRKHNWMATALIGFLACMTKNQGCILAFAVVAELFYSEKGFRLLWEKRWKEFWKRVICPGLICALMVFGFVVYLGINDWVEGDPFRFLYYQEHHWNGSFCPMWRTLSYLAEYAFGYGDISTRFAMWIPEFVLFFVWVSWIVYGIRRKIRPTFLVYLVLLWLLTYSSSWLLSAGRYTLCALPGFMLMGEWLSRHEKWKTPVVAVSSMLFMIYMTGFLMGKQIM